MTSPLNSKYFPPSNTQFPTPEEVKRELADILSQPEYNRTYGSDYVDKLWEWILNLLLRTTKWISKLFGLEAEGIGHVMSTIFACLVILAFLALTALVIRRVASRVRAEDNNKNTHQSVPYGLPSAESLLRQAEKLANQGNCRGAFSSAYLALISRLDEAGMLRFEQSRTNWEYIRELAERGREQISNILMPLTSLFDRKIYGSEPCDITDYHAALEAYNIVSSEVAT